MPKHRTPPWYLWPLYPFFLVAGLVVLVPLSLLAAVSIPYFWLYPERHRRQHDFSGTPRQQEVLARWRRRCARLGVWRRVRRAIYHLRHRHPAA